MIVGYVRVSTVEQNEARQVEALGDVEKIFLDNASGKDTDRPQLTSMLEWVREGDIVRVKSVDRLARSTRDLLELLNVLEAKGVGVEFVDSPALSTNSPQGRFVLTVLGAVAEFERALIRERQAEGIALAKKRGVYEKQRKLDADAIARARELIEKGVPKAEVARQLGVSRQTLYASLQASTV
ncbi:MAG: recombinase family protein [Actinomycetaceae bacterium]|nr:recombinase family protein [Actinomycetaceae bacterium]